MPDHDRFGSLSSGAYNSPDRITGSDPDNFTETAQAPAPANTIINRNEPTRVYTPHDADNNDLAQHSFADSDHVDPAASQPNKWVHGRDPYKHLGMPGEDYLDNSNSPTTSTENAPTSDGGPATL